MSKKIDNMEIMKNFFDEPNRSYHIRELAKLININPTTVTSYLEEFRNKGLLTKTKERNHVIYRADTTNQFFKEEKRHYNIMKLRESGVIDFLNEKLNYPESIILFGSYAKAENTKDSDIDIFILSETKKELNLEKFEQKLNAKIQIFIHTKKEVTLMKKKNKDLLNSIINGTNLQGFFEVL